MKHEHKKSVWNKKKGALWLVTLLLMTTLAAGCGVKVTASPMKTTVASEVSVSDLEIEPYSGQPYAVINDNIPSFSEEDMTTKSFEKYSALDSDGRCGEAFANIGKDLMPTEKRGPIGKVKPSGWQTVKYDCVDGKYLYNRCHLIGYQLTAENANKKNLITGTRYLNVDGMLPFENMVADYIHETGNHVLYRVTPIFEGDNLVASGVQMEAKSVEDDGEGILFNVFCYNVQPGVKIDYETGKSTYMGEDYMPEDDSRPIGTGSHNKDWTNDKKEENVQSGASEQEAVEETFVLNTNTKKFHRPSCSSISRMKESNKEIFTGSREKLTSQGYDACKRCNP